MQVIYFRELIYPGQADIYDDTRSKLLGGRYCDQTILIRSESMLRLSAAQLKQVYLRDLDEVALVPSPPDAPYLVNNSSGIVNVLINRYCP
jgi:hypothetical protein